MKDTANPSCQSELPSSSCQAGYFECVKVKIWILPKMFFGHSYSPFLHYRLVSSLQDINIGKTGNQNHPDLKVRVVLVTCISNID